MLNGGIGAAGQGSTSARQTPDRRDESRGGRGWRRSLLGPTGLGGPGAGGLTFSM